MAITHQSLIASLSSGQRRALSARSDGAGLLHLAGHGGAVAAVAALILNQAPCWPALLAVQGILVSFLVTALHETIHRTAFKSDWLNGFVAAVCAGLVFLPPKWFRYFHFEHHRFSNDPENDPELATAKPRTFAQYALYLSGLPVWWFQFRALAVNAAGSFLIGVLIEVTALVWSPSPELRAFLVAGVLGSFTTVSAFSLEVLVLLERGASSLAGLYLTASVTLSLAGIYAGMRLLRLVLS